MPLQQWPSGGRLLERRCGQVYFPAILTCCSIRGCSRSNARSKPPIPPQIFNKDIVISPPGFFPPSLPRMSLSAYLPRLRFAVMTGVSN